MVQFFTCGSIKTFHNKNFNERFATMHTVRDISKERGKNTDLVFFKNEIAIYTADEPGKIVIKDLRTDKEKTVNESGLIFLLSRVVEEN